MDVNVHVCVLFSIIPLGPPSECCSKLIVHNSRKIANLSHISIFQGLIKGTWENIENYRTFQGVKKTFGALMWTCISWVFVVDFLDTFISCGYYKFC